MFSDLDPFSTPSEKLPHTSSSTSSNTFSLTMPLSLPSREIENEKERKSHCSNGGKRKEINPFGGSMTLPTNDNSNSNYNSSKLTFDDSLNPFALKDTEKEKVNFDAGLNPFFAMDTSNSISKNQNQQTNWKNQQYPPNKQKTQKELMSFENSVNPFSLKKESDKEKESEDLNNLLDMSLSLHTSKGSMISEGIDADRFDRDEDIDGTLSLKNITTTTKSNIIPQPGKGGIYGEGSENQVIDNRDQPIIVIDEDDYGISWTQETDNQPSPIKARDKKEDKEENQQIEERNVNGQMSGKEEKESEKQKPKVASQVSSISLSSSFGSSSSLGDSSSFGDLSPSSASGGRGERSNNHNNINDITTISNKNNSNDKSNNSLLPRKPFVVFSGLILARVTNQSLFARRWKPHYWVIVNRRLWIYRKQEDYRDNDYLVDPFSKRIKQCIALRDDIQLSEIKKKQYPGHEFPLQIFNLEQFDEEDSSRRVVAKFGAYQYHLVKNLYNHLDSQLFEEKHGVQSQRNLESQTNALKQSQRLNLDINVNGNGNENGSSHGSPSSVSRGAVTDRVVQGVTTPSVNLHEITGSGAGQGGRYNDNSSLGNAYVREFC